jgi:CubicO group peptidase (beta-lactamase class C family)
MFHLYTAADESLTGASHMRQSGMFRRSFLQSAISAPLMAASWKDALPRPFETEILAMMEVGPVPGALIGTLRAGKPGWTHALGVRNIETRAPVLTDTIFQAASLSKQATAYAAFALEKTGKLDFDKPLVSYLDDLEDERARTVTIRQVLSHSSGFPNWRGEPGQKLIPSFSPGSKFQYSGEGYFYLQRIMESVTGRGFGELMNALVFEPLKMTSTSMTWKPEWAERYALPHDRRGELRKNWDKQARSFHDLAVQKGQTVNAWKYADYEAAARRLGITPLPNSLLPNAAASMITTAPDYARFLSAAISNPAIRKEQIRIRPSLGWSLGWGLERIDGREYLWQWGDNGGYKNFVAVEPAIGNAIFVFTNGDSGTRIYDRIVTHATGHDHPALFWV